MSEIITIAGSPSPASRSSAVLDYVRATLETQGYRTAAIRVRDIPAEDLIFARADSPALQSAIEQLRNARAVVIGTPIYKAAYSGILKTFLDVLPQHIFATTPILPIATGGSPLHALALDYGLLPVLAALGAQHTLNSVYIVDNQIQFGAEQINLEGTVAARLTHSLTALTAAIGKPTITAFPQTHARHHVSAAAEDVRSADAIQLIKELSAELAELYQTSDGSAGFQPEDVEVPRAAFIIARINGVAVGCGALRPLDADSVEVKRMYTRSAYRRQGVAQAILSEIERLAQQFGYRHIKLQTGPRQPEAAALYERVGYYRIPRFAGNWERVLAYQKDVVPDAKTVREAA